MKALFGEPESEPVSLTNQALKLTTFDTKRVYKVWTDGSCLATRNIDGQKVKDCCGGWGFLIVDPDGNETRKWGSDEDTTISRMELMAVIKALKRIEDGASVLLTTDSQYVQVSAETRLEKWVKHGFHKGDGSRVSNSDLWAKVVKHMNRLVIKWNWVKGHTGDYGNEVADVLAGKGRAKALATSGRFEDKK